MLVVRACRHVLILAGAGFRRKARFPGFFRDIPQAEARIFSKIYEEQVDWVCQEKSLRAA